jgi:hypothetical protein
MSNGRARKGQPRKSISDMFSVFAVVCMLACSAVCSV